MRLPTDAELHTTTTVAATTAANTTAANATTTTTTTMHTPTTTTTTTVELYYVSYSVRARVQPIRLQQLLLSPTTATNPSSSYCKDHVPGLRILPPHRDMANQFWLPLHYKVRAPHPSSACCTTEIAPASRRQHDTPRMKRIQKNEKHLTSETFNFLFMKQKSTCSRKL